MFVGLDFDDSAGTWPDTALLLENALCLWRDIVQKQIDELCLLCRRRKVDIVEQQDPTKIRDSQRRRIEIRLQIFIIRVHLSFLLVTTTTVVATDPVSGAVCFDTFLDEMGGYVTLWRWWDQRVKTRFGILIGGA
jgi:hypothetical protein